ncbi:MAG: hypothetical protein EBT61_18165 [Verrucomicrobia bacterium]|nr:hypothetical protein [Verrucomicrobiota bacterium]
MSKKAEKQAGIAVHCSHDRMVAVTEIVANPRNPNKHPAKQVALLAKIIRHQGWRAPIVVSKRSGFVVAGHGRLAAAQPLAADLENALRLGARSGDSPAVVSHKRGASLNPRILWPTPSTPTSFAP